MVIALYDDIYKELLFRFATPPLWRGFVFKILIYNNIGAVESTHSLQAGGKRQRSHLYFLYVNKF
ncbi:hypothetical protein COS33_00505 [Candidatus Wolfebacteria bacterium CG02_land_8_20_14_3_00_37_12]|uniref:Uncharacterized protein n=1 Tax=Candidatus Wolfebacteria bacterium CG02_land_8_20_14_3_00_37_12 TaxID=1975066 RepID=A0A2M7CQK7_9BACT|nr:MAG: hypothetical protein COS33_00505 [Candidatus Wolfebacteria bacterium CG02_land_8_20_14_3_00_37_12]